MIIRKIVKSKASRVHPSQAATQAYHCSRVGSFHHGIWAVSDVAIAHPPPPAGSLAEPCRQDRVAISKCHAILSQGAPTGPGASGPVGDLKRGASSDR